MKPILLFFSLTFVVAISCTFDKIVPEKEPEPDPVSTSICDSITVSFANDVTPIFENNCYGCHATDPPSGNIRVNDYDGVKTIIENDRLLPSIRHEDGAVAMPRANGGLKMADSLITIIECWIEQGYPNN